MKLLSLFSGVGGFDLGLEQAGMTTVFQCEWDKHATKVLERHWPTVPRWGDISTLTGAHVLNFAPEIDVVAWGSPCQDLSIAGRRTGLDGTRSSLFYEGTRIIKEIREATNGRYPRISIWENVAGALSSNSGLDFGRVLDEMAEAGSLEQEWRVLDAQYFGVPQRRRRVFLVSVFDSSIAERCAEPILPFTEGMRRHTSPGGRKATTATASIDARADRVGSQTDNGNERIVKNLSASDWKFPQQQQAHDGKIVVTKQPIVFENSRRDGVRLYRDDVAHTLQAHMGTGGNNTPLAAIGIQGNVIGRQHHNGPAGKGHTEEGDPMFTLNTIDQHAVATELVVRRLTPIECERLMGWPDDWTAGQADSHRYKQCGNGVASPVAQWIGEQLMRFA